VLSKVARKGQLNLPTLPNQKITLGGSAGGFGKKNPTVGLSLTTTYN
jgi:hypothetical protein